ncbi:hypothetical protein FRACYDRAFT_247935 [Fragilariopsis cylindrus CCMP1102]|uniref:Cellulase n=1 Tax=Fragilariopsis cylindrus CCMP1102 TaxID=635003 RepID=A0A1E7EUZ6_9STRA|nr:hypothetical protein FRACYDRAFT_247935 [Fragilariopsis cylindrus CCMP1102]|eukprot:OEU09679.1 hypothetical protein FRACYDRAFT_247935 [Fragilariopsis cylindrus CCMP1102]
MTSDNLDDDEQRILDWVRARADDANERGPGMLKTYDNSDRHDTYDNAVAAILFDLHSDTAADTVRAEQILDRFIVLIDEGDEQGNPTFLAAAYNTDGSINDSREDAGNNAWACIALAYHGSLPGTDSRYLYSAKKLKDKIKEQLNFTHNFNEEKPHCVDREPGSNVTNSSTEHATDLIAVGRLLDDTSLVDTCQQFVDSMWRSTFFKDVAKGGAYATGTTQDQPPQVNYNPCPVDCQTWTLLADADKNATTDNRDRQGLAVMESKDFYPPEGETYDNITYHGVEFSNEGHGIQMENTASSAMAIAKFLRENKDKHVDGKTELEKKMNAMRDTLILISKNHNGVLACVNPKGITTGEGYRYSHTPHLASTAWTGLFLGYLRSDDFNPYRLDKIVNKIDDSLSESGERPSISE